METTDSPLPAQRDVAPHGPAIERSVRICVAAYLVFLCWQWVSTSSVDLHLPWFTRSDEIVVAAEVIRFSNSDFHQQFFDMPGTPFMLLGTAQWRLFYAWSVFHGFHGDANLFSFQHLEPLVKMLRLDNVIFFLLSSLLLFRIVTRIFNPFAGAAAATLLLMNPAYDLTAVSVRVEPLAMCFLLGAILVLTECSWRSAPLLAGLLMGLEAAERLHSVTATLPILTLLLFRQTWGREADYSAGIRRGMAFLAGLLLLGSAYLYYFFGLSSSPLKADYSPAFSLFAKASLALFILVAIAVLLYLRPQSRRAVVNTLTPKFAGLLAGAAVGFALGVPTIFFQYRRLLLSMSFYSSTYRDPVAMHLPLGAKIFSYLRFYIKIIAPDIITLILLVSGAGLVLFLPRFRTLWPYLVAAASFFFSKPLDLVRAEHHVSLWIPFYAMLSVVPLVVIYDAWKNRSQRWQYLTGPVALLALLALCADMKKNPEWLEALARQRAVRLHNIELSRTWIDANTEKDSSFVVAFYCLGPESFYAWFREMGLRPPVAQTDQREYATWWGNKSGLKGRAGFVCMSPMDVPVIKDWELREPGGSINPLADSRFHLVQSFGQGSGEIFLLRFDLSHLSDDRPAGFTFSMPAALRLASISAYDKSTVQGTSPTLVSTSPALWTYAAFLPLTIDRATSRLAWVHVRGRVLSGNIGIGLLDQQANSILNEQSWMPSQNVKDVYIACGPSGNSDGLLIRNLSTRGRSQLAIEQTEVLGRARQISPVARLEEIELSYNQASIVRQPQWTVTTAPQQWSYAATIPFHSSSQAAGIVVKIRAHVLEGEVGFSLLAMKNNTLHFEQKFSKSTDPIEVFLPVTAPEGLSRLLIRDTAPNGTRSRVVLDAIETWQLE